MNLLDLRVWCLRLLLCCHSYAVLLLLALAVCCWSELELLCSLLFACCVVCFILTYTRWLVCLFVVRLVLCCLT